MLIKNLFERDIFRPINGVVKADQVDDSSVWQELDEFVITRELDQHFRKFISWYLEAVDQSKNPDPTGKMGIWISGFFGSGKSHFLKVLSYLLNNRTHTNNGHSKQAVEFFESKVKDAMLFADIKRAIVPNTDVILFNIDSKAGHGSSTGRDLILRVFVKVLNELQGFSGDHPHIAHMERYLESKGKLKAFHAAYKKHTGLNWLQERDAYQFNRDEVVKALSETLGQSQAAAETGSIEHIRAGRLRALAVTTVTHSVIIAGLVFPRGDRPIAVEYPGYPVITLRPIEGLEFVEAALRAAQLMTRSIPDVQQQWPE